MARTAVTITALKPAEEVAQPAQTEVKAEDNGVVKASDPLEEIVLEVETGAEATTVEVVAGDNPPALEAGQGALKAEVAKESTVLLGPFTSGRFIQSGEDAGHLFIDTNKNISVRAYHVPRTA